MYFVIFFTYLCRFRRDVEVDLTSKLVGSSSKKYVAVKWALLKGKMSFMSFFRALHAHKYIYIL